MSKINPELSSKCCDFQIINSNKFNGFIQLKSIGKLFGIIRIPIKFHKRANKWKETYKMKTSFLFSHQCVEIRWEKALGKKTEGITVGADSGYRTTITFSNRMETIKIDKHSHSLESITHKMARQKKGSKAFEKTKKQRENFINWQINNINLSDVKIVKLEKVNVKYKRQTSRLMSHWSHPLIRDKLLRKCEELEVLVIQQSPTYRSQRCHQCGLVRKANRKGKEYKCSGCGMICDADLNAAINHEQELPSVPYNLRKLRKNRGNGFYWKPSGFFEITGEELRVPLSNDKR